MKLRHLFLISSILCSVGCAKVVPQAKPVEAVAKAPEKTEPVKPTLTLPKGWKTVSGPGYAFGIPASLKEVKLSKTEDSPRFAAKTSNDEFLFAFDFRADIKTVKRHMDQVLESFEEMDADVQAVKPIEIDEHDGVAIVATHEGHAFIVLAFVKDNTGYQFSCGATNEENGQSMVDGCLAIAETFKFSK